ncbi:MAG TPA: Sec-independent protein translocase protein TatB, partial [Rhizomicrobium sp.]|nr:Sec-independent protein translocase protein TatB [Rhizomicrobium sp.]
LVVALVVVGPKDLPRLMHMAGKWAGKARAMANEFRKSFDEMARQAELDELRKEIEDLKKNNPVTDMQNELNRAVEGVNLESGPSMTEAVSAEPVPDIGAEPRSGEFEITESKTPAPAEIEPPLP